MNADDERTGREAAARRFPGKIEPYTERPDDPTERQIGAAEAARRFPNTQRSTKK